VLVVIGQIIFHSADFDPLIGDVVRLLLLDLSSEYLRDSELSIDYFRHQLQTLLFAQY